MIRRSSRVADSSASQTRGAFIVFEGLDRSGKSTQCSRVVEDLKGKGVAVVGMRFPDRSTPVGQDIDRYLSSGKEVDMETIHNLFSLNRREKMQEMKELLLAGTTLIVDRYAFSGVAYSAAKGLDLQWCKIADAGLLAPDLVVFLDVSPEAASMRGKYGSERYEKLEFQTLVAEKYLQLKDSSWRFVNASHPLERVTSEVESHISEVLRKCGSSCPPPLKCLWDFSETEKELPKECS